MAPPATKEAAKAAGPAKKVLVRGAADLQVRPKKLYKAKDDKPALSKKAQAQLNAQKAGEAVSREKLAAALRDGINGKLEMLENFGGIEEVHFTSFVLQ